MSGPTRETAGQTTPDSIQEILRVMKRTGRGGTGPRTSLRTRRRYSAEDFGFPTRDQQETAEQHRREEARALVREHVRVAGAGGTPPDEEAIFLGMRPVDTGWWSAGTDSTLSGVERNYLGLGTRISGGGANSAPGMPERA